MRKKIVAGNWKMNKNVSETEVLLSEIKTKLDENSEAQVIVAPTFTNLYKASQELKQSHVIVAAQNMHQAKNGAFTGEISADMLNDIGVHTVILGHSERRAYFGETDALLAEKVNTALEHNMTVIFCFGEELQDRKSDNHFAVVESQLKHGLFHISKDNWKNIVLAYEPVGLLVPEKQQLRIRHKKCMLLYAIQLLKPLIPQSLMKSLFFMEVV